MGFVIIRWRVRVLQPAPISKMASISEAIFFMVHRVFQSITCRRFPSHQRITNGLPVGAVPVLIHTLLVWRYSLITSTPPSRPRPERL